MWALESAKLDCIFRCFPLQDWSGQNISSIASEICGFITVLTGTIILHGTKEQEETTRKGIGQHVTFNQFPCVCNALVEYLTNQWFLYNNWTSCELMVCLLLWRRGLDMVYQWRFDKVCWGWTSDCYKWTGWSWKLTFLLGLMEENLLYRRACPW